MGHIALSIDQLLLDTGNPRLSSPSNQREVMQAILDDQGEKLYELAESITDDGMSPIDLILVMREKPRSKRFIALEGNRRVAALRILLNPQVLTSLNMKPAPMKRFQLLATNFDRNNVEPIACFEVPNREDAAQWIWLRHTGQNDGKGIVDWSGLAAAKFRGSDPALQALEFVRLYGDLTELQRLRSEKNFPISTLDRLLNTNEVLNAIGVEVVDRKLQSGLPPDELMKPLRKIVVDLIEKKVNSRNLNAKNEQIAYVSSFDSNAQPDLSQIGNLKTLEEIHGSDFGLTPTAAAPKRLPPDPSTRKTIVPPKVRLNVTDNKTAAIFRELRRIKVNDFPNAGAVLFRVFLEHSVDSFFDTHNLSKKYVNKQNRTIDKTLRQKVLEVIDYLVDNEGEDKKNFESVRRGLGDPQSPLSIDLLNRYVHNLFETPRMSDLLSAWNNSQRFFERIWA